MNKMRGFIEPYTLGFILALLGSSIGYFSRDIDSEAAVANQAPGVEQISESNHGAFQEHQANPLIVN